MTRTTNLVAKRRNKSVTLIAGLDERVEVFVRKTGLSPKDAPGSHWEPGTVHAVETRWMKTTARSTYYVKLDRIDERTGLPAYFTARSDSDIRLLESERPNLVAREE